MAETWRSAVHSHRKQPHTRNSILFSSATGPLTLVGVHSVVRWRPQVMLPILELCCSEIQILRLSMGGMHRTRSKLADFSGCRGQLG